MVRLVPLTLATFMIMHAAALAQGASYDGVYSGAPVSGTGCSLFSPVIRVQNGTATLRLNPSTTFEGQVGKDGSLDVQFGTARLAGRFGAGKFDGSVSSRNCQYTLALTR